MVQASAASGVRRHVQAQRLTERSVPKIVKARAERVASTLSIRRRETDQEGHGAIVAIVRGEKALASFLTMLAEERASRGNLDTPLDVLGKRNPGTERSLHLPLI
jgi:hypothetical protein